MRAKCTSFITVGVGNAVNSPFLDGISTDYYAVGQTQVEVHQALLLLFLQWRLVVHVCWCLGVGGIRCCAAVQTAPAAA